MKLLVTGGLGFIGSNFILRALETSEDYEIINIDDEMYGSNHKNLSALDNSKKYKFVKGNINNLELIDNMVSKCDAVINFAAESHVDRSISNAKPFIDSNIVGVFSILEAIKKNKKRLIHISTDEVFGSLEKGTADEKFNFNPSSPYAASKASAELLVKSYVKTYDCDCVITRCTNNYGPRQFPEKLIPKVIILAKQNKQIPIYGSGKNIRDWIYVDDHCDVILKVLKEGKKGESYNISANNEIDNLAIIKKILALIGKSTDMMTFVDDRPGHDFRYSLDSTKIRKEFGWKEKVNFEEGMNKTMNWYLENKEWWETIPEKEWKETPWKKSN
ncbi:dTDP-glucose 4,6-dehydratase [Nitrosopumilus sp. b3]|uniref:dTDP-glucose 4,6-dehydratase n=1 Tax=Nitrosopumilus sp. b3 TaxID=2109909 RepID=UPI0015F60374|nr:dTDP-glucose 4,6-dehydratase [Nitrosopumilus sp. b3]KAF6246725.1 dTDP-glucose 4,6-dehydratase [Nitrosopumilus sp. b3]